MEPGQFEGTIGRWFWESEQWWPTPTRAPGDAPNVVVMLLDDVGFAQFGPYGSDIETPTFDRLAAGGLTFTNFHTTALCSPTRACVLTGRNHHSVGMGRIVDLATGFPGYDAHISRTHGFLSEMLTPEGWAAYAVGKWHLTPRDLHHLGADRSTWPLGRGFERYYGFFDGETHQFSPALVHDNHQVLPPGDHSTGYHFTEDITDRAIEWVSDLRNGDPDKPFFLYYTPGACHSPHHAPQSYLDMYRGRFDEGWDVWRERCFARQLERGIVPPTTELSERPDWVPAWDELSDDEKRVAARYMEAFAAMLTHTDHQIGRFVDFLASTGDLDNTLLMVLSDNGASSEGQAGGSLNDVRHWNGLHSSLRESVERIDEIGGPTIHNNYPFGWTMAGNTPYRRWKREVHEGGVADPLIVHWPARIGDAGAIRHHYVHAIDLLPTVLQACGVEAPDEIGGRAQSPIEGSSMLGVLDDGDHPEVRTTQYFEMFGCRALYQDGYKAVTYHPIHVQEPGLEGAAWELYDVRVDPSECHDLSDAEPERLASMIERWWAEAEAHNVLPVDNRPFSDFTLARPRNAPREAGDGAATELRDDPRGLCPGHQEPLPHDHRDHRRGRRRDRPWRAVEPGVGPRRLRAVLRRRFRHLASQREQQAPDQRVRSRCARAGAPRHRGPVRQDRRAAGRRGGARRRRRGRHRFGRLQPRDPHLDDRGRDDRRPVRPLPGERRSGRGGSVRCDDRHRRGRGRGRPPRRRSRGRGRHRGPVDTPPVAS